MIEWIFGISCSTWVAFLLYRYLREIISIPAYLLHKPIPLPEEPALTSQDVTVIIPSLEGYGLEDTICSILATDPYQVILVTIDANIERARTMVKGMMRDKVRVLSVAQPNKRRQMVRAIPEIRTKVTIFADDDVTWPETLLPRMLAPLEREEYGGVGTNQRIRRAQNPTVQARIWNFLGAVYLMRRNWDCTACNFIDGGLPCLSGRTVAYRTKIISEDAFTDGFTNEVWGLSGNYQLNADDDNFITRWLVSHGWKIAFQHHKDAEVLTDLEDNPKFLLQCLRWSRSNWRSNVTSMFVEGQVWRLQPWSAYSVFLTTLTHLAVVWDICLWYWCPKDLWTRILLITLWILTKTVKLIPHFLQYPVDFLLLPVSIFFGYFHGFIKIYALFTLYETTWGSRPGADANDADRMIHITPQERNKAAESRAQDIYTQ